MNKLITFAVPCYNSAAYMAHCIDTLLTAGKEAEIILVDDGSKDETGAIADNYAMIYPDIVRVIHQENGGHGEGVNQGLAHATGLYYKVVDSDDWLDLDALQKLMKQLRVFAHMAKPVDLVVANYVYEHVEDGTSKPINYRNVFPVNTIFSWQNTRRFRPSQYLLMHSCVYRTELLRESGLKLPKHTFYVDNIFVYQPLPYVESIYYMDIDLYRYFIGRQDQSVNEAVMVKRVDQQLRVTRIMLDVCDLEELAKTQPKLSRYMFNYLSMMVAICSILCLLSQKPEDRQKKLALWRLLKEKNPKLYHHMKYRSISAATVLPGESGRMVGIGLYRLARKIYKFN